MFKAAVVDLMAQGEVDKLLLHKENKDPLDKVTEDKVDIDVVPQQVRSILTPLYLINQQCLDLWIKLFKLQLEYNHY